MYFITITSELHEKCKMPTYLNNSVLLGVSNIIERLQVQL